MYRAWGCGVVVACAGLACGVGTFDAEPAGSQDAGSSSSSGEPALTCAPERGLFAVREALAASDPCAAWLRPLAERAVRVEASAGSAVLWSLRAPAGPALALSAAHVLSPCYAIEGCAAQLSAPGAREPVMALRLTEPSGVYASRRSAGYPLANPALAVHADGSFAEVLPRQDWSVYVVDGQSAEPWTSTASPLDGSAPGLSEVAVAALRAAPSWAAAQPGSSVIAVGYPLARAGTPSAFASVFEVLDEASARAAWQAMAAQGVDEGAIPFEPEVEVWLRGEAVPGLSGSGVFDSDGRLIGVIVRGAELDGVPYARAVRLHHVVEQLRAMYSELPAAQQASVADYLEPELLAP